MMHTPPPPPPMPPSPLNDARWSSSEDKTRSPPSRSRSRDEIPAPPPPRLPGHQDLASQETSPSNPLALEALNQQFDAPLGEESSNKLRTRTGSSSSLPKRRRAAKKAILDGGSLHSKLMEQQQWPQQQQQQMRNAEFHHQQLSPPVLRRRGQKKDVLERTASTPPQMRRKSGRRAASRSNSTQRRRRRRSRHSASPLHATVLGCMGSNLFDGAASGDSSDSIEISSDDEEYNSQDSPAKSFPSSPLMSSLVRKTSHGRSESHSGDASVNSKGSNITAISDMFLRNAVPNEAEDETFWDERKLHSKRNKRKESRMSNAERRQGRIIQALLLALFVCGSYIANGIIMGPVEAVKEESRNEIRTASTHTDADAHTDPNLEVYDMYEEQLNELQSQVDSLQTTMQQLAMRQLADSYFDGDVPPAGATAEVKLDLGGLLTGHSFAVQVSHDQLPYATWVFLRELSDGDWILRSKDQWLEIVAAPSQEKETRYVRQSISPSKSDRLNTYESFDHLEKSINVDRTFIVGMRNPKEGEVGVVISIYKERGMCGNYENEVCFGKISNGISALNAVTELGENIPIKAISTHV